MTRHRIYVASKTRHVGLWLDTRRQGVPIISTWIDEAGPDDTPDFAELWVRIQMEIGSATRLVFFAEAEDVHGLKGGFIEVGMALMHGLPVYVVLSPEIRVDGRTLAPIGSWLKHPGVRMVPTLYDAFHGNYCSMPACRGQGEPGNGNIIDGKLVCDYCHAQIVGLKIAATPETLA